MEGQEGMWGRGNGKKRTGKGSDGEKGRMMKEMEMKGILRVT